MRLINGDCLEEMSSIPDQSIDLILCDPPYGTTQAKWDSIIPVDELWKHYKRIIKPNGVIVLFGIEPFSSFIRVSNKSQYKYDWKWVKEQGTNQLNAKIQPLRQYEDIMVFYKKQPTYNPQMSTGKPYKINRNANTDIYGSQKAHTSINTGTRYPTNILYFNRELKPRYHPTQKPVELLRYLIRTYTNEGDTVLDNTMGSGSTGLAAALESREFIGIELNKEYYDIAIKRCNYETN